MLASAPPPGHRPLRSPRADPERRAVSRDGMDRRGGARRRRSRSPRRCSRSKSSRSPSPLQLADALAEAHAHGVVHRDLKPGNALLVDGDVNRVKLIDFGIARRPASELTLTGSRSAHPGTWRPSKRAAKRTWTPRADVFSLGCILYRCIAGTPPFGGNDVPRRARQDHSSEEPKPLLEDGAAALSPTLDRLVMRMLSRSRRFGLRTARPCSPRSAAARGPPARPARLDAPARAVDHRHRAAPRQHRPRDEPDRAEAPGGHGRHPGEQPGRADQRLAERAELASRIRSRSAPSRRSTPPDRGPRRRDARRDDRPAKATRRGSGRAGGPLRARHAIGGAAAGDRRRDRARRLLQVKLPMGDVIDRATAPLLEDLDASASGVVELDDVTAALLDGALRGHPPRRPSGALLRDLGAARRRADPPRQADAPCVGRERAHLARRPRTPTRSCRDRSRARSAGRRRRAAASRGSRAGDSSSRLRAGAPRSRRSLARARRSDRRRITVRDDRPGPPPRARRLRGRERRGAAAPPRSSRPDHAERARSATRRKFLGELLGAHRPRRESLELATALCISTRCSPAIKWRASPGWALSRGK